MGSLERTLLEVKPVSSPQPEPVRNEGALGDVSGSLDIERKPPTEPATGLHRITALWPGAFLALAGAVTLAWAIGLGWAAVALVRWLVG